MIMQLYIYNKKQILIDSQLKSLGLKFHGVYLNQILSIFIAF